MTGSTRSVPSVSPITFQASWNTANEPLKDSTLDKVKQCVFFLINRLAAMFILPSTMKSDSEVKASQQRFDAVWKSDSSEGAVLRKHYTPEPIEVTTPNGVKIRGIHFKNRHLAQDAKTVLCFQPNAMLSKQGAFDWLMEKSALYDKHAHFITFDYRGAGESESRPYSGKDLILDGESIYQFTVDKLGVSPQKHPILWVVSWRGCRIQRQGIAP